MTAVPAAAAFAGAVSHRAGLAAEAAVAAHYLRRGLEVLAQRWRGHSGELDLVLRAGRELVIVEVKKSRRFASAAARVSPRQVARLFDAAAEYLSGMPQGQATPMRFDVALVNVHGEIDIIENALGP